MIKKRIIRALIAVVAVIMVTGVAVVLAPLSFWIDLTAWHLGAQNDHKNGCDPGAPYIKLKKEFPRLPEVNQLVGMYQAPGNQSDWYLLKQNGLVYKINQSSSRLNVFLDISRRVNSGGEKGLLGLAFHPFYRKNGFLFVYYTTNNLVSRISRFSTHNPKSGIVNINTEKIILEVDQPESNHNGGQIAFGHDGYLYISLGDGGGAGDRHGKIGNAQNTATLPGSIIRLDIDTTNKYKIPPGNPLVNKRGRSEIYAWGIRNAWRMSFDQKTGLLWAADVGQDKWEEINLIRRGGNYGWRIKEASHCYNPPRNCSSKNLIDPIYEYSHQDGRSITGGYVYRGKKIPGLTGMYIFSDFFKGPLWALKKSPNGNYQRMTIMNLDFYTSSFAQGSDGEIYILNYAGGPGEAVFKIVKGRGCGF